MFQDEGGLFEALVGGAFRHYMGLIQDHVDLRIIIVMSVTAAILWWLVHATDLPAIAETSTDRSLVD